jgi:hypothetical protein
MPLAVLLLLVHTTLRVHDQHHSSFGKQKLLSMQCTSLNDTDAMTMQLRCHMLHHCRAGGGP